MHVTHKHRRESRKIHRERTGNVATRTRRAPIQQVRGRGKEGGRGPTLRAITNNKNISRRKKKDNPEDLAACMARKASCEKKDLFLAI